MKINFLQEAYFKDVTVKKVDNRTSAEKLSSGAKRVFDQVFVNQMVHDEKYQEFLLKIGNFYKGYISPNARSTPPSVVNLHFTSVENGVANFVADSYYTDNRNQRNYAPAETIIIRDAIINKSTIKEINDDIDSYVTKHYLNFFKHKPELFKVAKSIHIEKINLYANVPLGGPLKVLFDTDYYNRGIISSKYVTDILNKIGQLFVFCPEEVILDKSCVEIKELDKNLVYKDMEIAIKVSKEWENKIKNNPDKYKHYNKRYFASKTLSYLNNGMSSGTLNTFQFYSYIFTYNLHSFFNGDNSDIEKHVQHVLKEKDQHRLMGGIRYWGEDTWVITTATLKELEEIKDKLCTLIFVCEGFYSLPSPSTGFIEYFMISGTIDRNPWPDCPNSEFKDFIEGEFYTETEMIL